MDSDTFRYTGQSNLEVMLDAHNYNAYQLEFILAEVDRVERQPVRVLDFGSGIGTFADMVTSARPAAQVDCLEPSNEQAHLLRERGYTVLSDLSEAKDSYDVVYALNVLEHIQDDAGALRALRQVLSPGAAVVLYVPAFMLLFSNMDRLVEHHRRYRTGDFARLAAASGLQLRSARYCDPVGFFAALAYRLSRGSGSLNPRSLRLFDRYAFPVSAAAERMTGRLFGKNILAILTR